ncbi:MAG: hypothetical protein ABSF90_08990 [Syntrophobacteraceae bacterium]
MNKKLILGLALAVVLVSGSLFSAQAECSFGCLPHISLSSCLGNCAAAAQNKDMDRPDATCQGAYNYGPVAPTFSLLGVY